jgi:hypothetical protein
VTEAGVGKEDGKKCSMGTSYSWTGGVSSEHHCTVGRLANTMYLHTTEIEEILFVFIYF